MVFMSVHAIRSIGAGVARRLRNGRRSSQESTHVIPTPFILLRDFEFEMHDFHTGGGYSIEDDPDDRILQVEGLRYVCSNCANESTLWKILTIKKEYISNHPYLLSYRDSLEVDMVNRGTDRNPHWVVRVAPGWEVI